MRYYSDKTQKFYDTEKACVAAEAEATRKEELQKIEAERKTNERKAAAEKVDKAYKAMLSAQQAYRDELSAFCEKYGTYHLSIDDSRNIPSLFDIFNPFLFDR